MLSIIIKLIGQLNTLVMIVMCYCKGFIQQVLSISPKNDLRFTPVHKQHMLKR